MGNSARNPGFFWHHLGNKADGSFARGSKDEAILNDWWLYLLRKGEISASFGDNPGGRGERLLKSYISGDTIIMYSSGYGAIGWGRIDKPKHVLVKKGSAEDVFPPVRGEVGHWHRHRLMGISWGSTGDSMDSALPITEIRRKIGLNHPRGTRQEIPQDKARKLIGLLDEHFADRDTQVGSDEGFIALERAQGFQSDPKIRRAVEKYAMARAREALEARGYDGFEETASTECYDYTCHKDGHLRYVEVKGTQTDGSSVILTYNEVEHCRAHPDGSIFVLVHSIKLVDAGTLKLRNGTLKIRDPWTVEARDLKPVQYSWIVQ